VRVNRIFAEMTEGTMSGHLGRTLAEVLPVEAATQLKSTIERVFEEDRPIRDIELSGVGAAWNWTWIANAYPIRTLQQEVRWVGLIVLDATDRKRSEEALRKTEKLAATGRLAASIAHEINNPLEAITNLLYLISNHAGLQEPALGWVQMAEHEVKRVAEITQQTLRFYRQSTQAARAKLSELVDSVLSLHQVRLQHRDIRVEKQYDPEMALYCFAGEIRQVFANLIGNAIDSMPDGGRLLVRARRTTDPRNPERAGVRFTVADTGCGIAPTARKHIFEAFFTTKEVTGTGLGLWVSSEIIDKHEGSIRVRSRQRQPGGGGSGTVFALFLPDMDQAHKISRETQIVEAAG
jgi:signal transduction histidine kinase